MSTKSDSVVHMVDVAGLHRHHWEEMLSAVTAVLSEGRYIRGPEVSSLQDELADYLSAKHVLGVGNGTDALQIAYMALGIGPGDEVITPAFTFIATAEAAALLGATPVFADIDPDTFNLDPARVEELITERTRAIVPVHLFGQAADLDPILEIGRRRGIAVVEDNAQAIGTTHRGRKTGSLASIGTLSFFPSKNLGACGDGGAVVTNDTSLHQRMSMVSNHGGRHKYYSELVGMNSRLDALQAAILRVKLRHLDSFIASRRAAAERYDALFADCVDIVRPFRAPYSRHGFHQYTIRTGRREAVAARLRERGIPFGIYYPVPLSELPVFAAPGAARSGPLPETIRACREVISLPMHTELTPDQQQRVADAVVSGVTA